MVTEVGATVIVKPVPTKVPPQLPLYHFHVAPVPKLPPVKESVVELPLQIVPKVALIKVAAVEVVFTVTVEDTHIVVLQVPSALAQ